MIPYSPKYRISYLLATKNRGKYLKHALMGIPSLKGKNDEVIVIDGGSTDDTKEIVAKYKTHIDIFLSEPDRSEGHAFNKGILLSRGKYIKIITDDDTFYRQGIEDAVEVLERNPHVDVLLCGGTKEREGRTYTVLLPKGTNYGSKVEDVFKYGGCGLGLLIRKSALAQTGIFNINARSLDIDFITQCIEKKATIKFCRINMFYHKIHQHSGIQKDVKKIEEDLNVIRKRYGISKGIKKTNERTEVIWDKEFS